MENASEHRASQAIVDLGAIQANVKQYLQFVSDQQKLFAVVKANAYGHGAVPVAKAAIEAGVQGLCVATVDEAIELRQNGVIHPPILVLGLTNPFGIAEILHYNITVTVCDLDFFRQSYQQLVKMGQEGLIEHYKLKFHLKLDTGMGRIGLQTREQVKDFVAGLAEFPWLDWEGVFTHFSTVGGGPREYVDYQWEHWQELLQEVPDFVKERHFANTAMIHQRELSQYSTICRLGIGLYGLDPRDRLAISDIQAGRFDHLLSANVLTVSDQAPGEDPKDHLQPAMQLVSEIVYVKEVSAGQKISYGATYEASEKEWIATIPIGYADGWYRGFKDIPVLVDGHACPVVGVINMDQLMIRLPKYYPEGTEVTLVGHDGGLYNHLSAMARKLNTIGYEIPCGISQRIPRVYI